MDKHIKDYIDKCIEVFVTRIEGMDKAIVIKTIEMDRRLAEHNDLRKEVVTDRVQLVRRDRYRSDKINLEEWKDRVDNKLTELSTRDKDKLTKTNWIAIFMVALTVLNIVILLFHSIE